MVQEYRRKEDWERYDPKPLGEVNELEFRYGLSFVTVPQLPLFSDDRKFKQNLEDPLARERR